MGPDMGPDMDMGLDMADGVMHVLLRPLAMVLLPQGGGKHGLVN
jgi:hypothetical protein